MSIDMRVSTKSKVFIHEFHYYPVSYPGAGGGTPGGGGGCTPIFGSTGDVPLVRVPF